MSGVRKVAKPHPARVEEPEPTVVIKSGIPPLIEAFCDMKDAAAITPEQFARLSGYLMTSANLTAEEAERIKQKFATNPSGTMLLADNTEVAYIGDRINFRGVIYEPSSVMELIDALTRQRYKVECNVSYSGTWVSVTSPSGDNKEWLGYPRNNNMTLRGELFEGLLWSLKNMPAPTPRKPI